MPLFLLLKLFLLVNVKLCDCVRTRVCTRVSVCGPDAFPPGEPGRCRSALTSRWRRWVREPWEGGWRLGLTPNRDGSEGSSQGNSTGEEDSRRVLA